MGVNDGIIIATIMTSHMPRNDAAAPNHVCPGIRIHAIDIVQPPGIGMRAVADIDEHRIIVIATLIANTSAETTKKARWGARSALTVFIMESEPSHRPVPLLIATLWGSIKDSVIAHQKFSAAGIGGIGVVSNIRLAYKNAESMSFRQISGDVGAGRARVLSDDRRQALTELLVA